MLHPLSTPWLPEDAAHLLNRAGFGATPERLAAWHALGREAAVEKLLAGAESPALAPRPEWFSAEEYRREAIDYRDQQLAFQAAGQQGGPEAREARRVHQRRGRRRTLEAAGWWIDRMARTEAPLVEKMTLFWHGHFATSDEKVRDPYLMLQQNELFRREALGSVVALAKAVSRDPAMMIYLDTDRSLRTKPNENFAREIMELFTLGEGHYTEKDIKEAARAFTGCRINRLLGRFFFHEASWDSEEKELFGQRGRFNGDDVIDLIFQKPQCAAFLAGKLWEFFVSENPTPGQIETVASMLRASHYEIAPVLRELFLSEAFYAPENRRSLIKSPVQFLVQARHVLELEELPPGLQLGALQQLGQSLFRPPNVAGWEGGRAWINTNTLLARYNIGGYLAKGPASGYKPAYAFGKPQEGKDRPLRDRRDRTLSRQAMAHAASLAPPDSRHNPAEVVRLLARRLYGTELTDAERRPFVDFLAKQETQPVTDEALANVLHLMMSTPQFQLC